MRLLPVLLLTAVLSVEPAHTLWCYQCEGFGGCMRNALPCPQSTTHCISKATRPLISPVDLPLVTKSCSIGCPDISPHVSISCCQASLCNVD